ncbi:hypothetical protein ACQKCH_14795 [Nubsella zeaxanthinifaciens]|uniref:hypothetical protein n=1 Tax=Nubsella zeaxanthinifaciens TaxID=392412 RepID=UPI003CFDD567
MSLKKLLSIVPLLVVPLLVVLFVVSCKKDSLLNEEELVENKLSAKDLFSVKKMSGSCMGTEETYDVIHISLIFPFLVWQTTYTECDGFWIDSLKSPVDWPDLQKDETDTTKIPEAVGPTSTSCPSGAIFDVNNMIHYTPNLTAVQRAVIQQVYDKVDYYNENEYNGSYVLADLEMYGGYGSRKRVVYATVGYLCSIFLSDVRFHTVVDNVPAIYSIYNNDCNQVMYKTACSAGVSYYTATSGGYGIPMTLEETFAHFLDELAAHRL